MKNCEGGLPEANLNQRHTPVTQSLKHKERSEMGRLSIISTISGRTGKRILKAMLDNFENMECVHLATPGGKIRELLNTLSVKLQGYTKQDCCILLIGEQDFIISDELEHASLVQEIITTVETITNTNIIVCTPTYICGAQLFNYRVELFNSRLNQFLQNSNVHTSMIQTYT